MLNRIDEEITFRKLEILLAFMESGNLARAAERLGISAVSVHRALHSLETGTRCSLFRLEGRNLQPNDAAHALADVAREVLQAMSHGIRVTREIAGYAADRIRIGSLYSLTSVTVPAIIMGLRLRKPDIQTELVLGSNSELLRKLREGIVDAAVMGLPEGAGDIESQLLFEDDIFFAAPAQSTYAQQADVDLSACTDERFVSLNEGYVTHDRFIDAFRVAGFDPNVVMRTNDIFSLMNLVSGGIGCTLLPGRIRSVLPRNVCLVPLQPRFQMRQKISVMFLRTRERDPNLLSLLAACRSHAADLQG
ncbi:LysR substrate-binding domain-containing protein [Piscinibacter terrae]|uniref:LysR family transcriptional regulator n=1 Tax=Piscinibacter terrae TaxID=2496871 RepID=A0A3N7IXK5_9BURK|nr:LysR substrate-binding domain-containing protein [Albitalea terrae]RQP23502.1 LysR family transcriptional regulator [Albitalea terrae]